MPSKITVIFAMLLLSALVVPLNTQAHAQSASFTIKLNLVPPQVEAGEASHRIGYLGIVSNDGLPIFAPYDIEVQLLSEDEDIAKVPHNVVIPSGKDHARFDIAATEIVGTAEISAFFGDQIVTQDFRVVAPQSQVPQDVNLVINLSSQQMQIGSEMPFSIYLEHNGTLLQSPADMVVTFDYERPLVKLDSDKIVIEKGSYYGIGKIRALEKSGNAFIKATTNNPQLSTVANMQIAQTQPTAIKVDVVPDDIGPGENTVDIFVSLLDSDANPTIASQNVRLELFANSTGILNLNQINAVIEKGSFGFHQRLSVRAFTGQGVEIGASASGLGVSGDTFTIVDENLSEGDPKAQIKKLEVFTIGTMPSEGTAVVGYQLNAVETDEDDGTDVSGDGVIDGDDFHPIDSLEDGELYPIQASKLFSKDQGNLFVVSSDNSAARIVDFGTLPSGRSYGVATVSSGKQADSVEISVSTSGGASGTGSINVSGGLNPVQTLIFSPAGKSADNNYRILFNENGFSDLFFVTLDSDGRPAASETGVKYLVKPINELAEIEQGKSFTLLTVSSKGFGQSEGISHITASPVGVNADSKLAVESDLDLIFFAGSVSKVMFPFDSILGISTSHDIGTVQLLDSFRNPLVPTSDLVARLTSSDPAIVQVPTTVTLGKGLSYIQFPVTTFGKAGDVAILASVEGVHSSSADLSSALLKMNSKFIENDERLRATVPGTVMVSTVEGATVLWGVPSSLAVKVKEDKATTFNPETNSYAAKLEVVASRTGNYTIDVTVLKDGFETERLSEHIFINPYISELQTFIEYSDDTIAYNKETPIRVTIEDENGQPIQGALIQVDTQDGSTVSPESMITDSSGSTTFTYTVTGSIQKATISVTATKEGYSDGEDDKELTVTGVPTNLPFWATYAAIAGVVAVIGGGVVYFMKRPKTAKRLDEGLEDEEEEI